MAVGIRVSNLNHGWHGGGCAVRLSLVCPRRCVGCWSIAGRRPTTKPAWMTASSSSAPPVAASGGGVGGNGGFDMSDFGL